MFFNKINEPLREEDRETTLKIIWKRICKRIFLPCSCLMMLLALCHLNLLDVPCFLNVVLYPYHLLLQVPLVRRDPLMFHPPPEHFVLHVLTVLLNILLFPLSFFLVLLVLLILLATLQPLLLM